ncbi:hypothetical protein EI975_21210 [Bacillus licheniformis]|uniref:hypothetical protein n=1 Tax=Bacillus subtilis group TaxID=653685 RepID=UPI0011EDFD11|nr:MULTISPECIES: hypothetical protein [Bacillus subtilis group]KAA0817057.1 hypothetical protein EI974_09445 [Bacillus licheniformis]KAA0829956.1 hypothetical protein EI980_16430 [Bacillus licheniformis]KAA0835312.1 hypothetical protein EI979_20530 [Bacillus paralicheniformis]KAA0844468.1 hypothetical protein EI975_21210 [Bacillus licheniformis]
MVLDDFYGGQRISNMALKMTPDINTPLDSVKENIEKAQEKVEETKKNIEKGAVSGGRQIVKGSKKVYDLHKGMTNPKLWERVGEVTKDKLSEVPVIGGLFK